MDDMKKNPFDKYLKKEVFCIFVYGKNLWNIQNNQS